MWHEARKHEKKLRGLMVDYRRRAERRREFYEKIRGDPASFLQIHGTQLKIHIDANISQAAENSLMPWMGNKDNLIDRFDVRAHLDYISPLCETNQTSQTQQTDVTPQLDRQINYERYRNLVQNEFLGLTESKYLQQIWLEERFGMNQTQKEQQQKLLTKKKLAEKKATIAYNYEDEDSSSYTVQHTKPNDSSESEESSDEDYDFDTSVNIDQLNNEMGHRINTIAHKFGMKNDDFVRYLDQDKTEAEKIKLAKELENEKSMFTGRKSRRERRALKEQRLLILRASNFDETTDRTVDDREHDDTHVQSSSDSEVSVDETKIEFITSFGGSSDDDKTTESQEKKQKNVVTKRKQKYKDILHEKIDSTPVVYGPTLPGEEINSSHNITSFNRNTSSRKRSYRYNHSSDSGNNRSRSRSYERKKHSIGETSKRYHRTRRTRSRSFDAKRSPQTRDTSFRRNNSKDYHRRSRSPRNSVRRRRSRSRNRSHIRSRSRDRSNQKTRLRSRSRSLMRKRSRSSSRSRRNDSKRVRRRSRSESISKIKRKRSESRGKRSRSRSQRSKSRSTYKSRTNRRSKSKSVDIKRIANKIITENVPKLKIEIIESSDQTNSDRHKLLHISPVHQIIVDEVQNNEDSSKQEIMQDVYTSKESKKLPSPPLKSYYRHDLCNTSSEDENEIISEKEKVNSDEGSKKSALSSANTYGHKLPSNMTPQERLKKKMQALIDKQYKLDKKAELEKLEKQEQERVDREEELREMTYRLKYRRDAYHRCRNSRSVSRSRSRTSSSSSSSSASSSTSSSSSSPSSY